MLNLIKSIDKGIKIAKDKSPAAFYGWAVKKLHDLETDWQEDQLHASDFKTLIKSTQDRSCPRQLWLRYHGAESKKDKLGKKIMWDQGKAMQYRFSWYWSLGLPVEWQVYKIEMDMSPGLPDSLTGHADLVLINQEEKKFIVVEVKTQRGASFHYLTGAKPDHVMQLQVYVNALKNIKKKAGFKVTGSVLYLDREGQNTPIAYPASQRLDLTSSYRSLQGVVKGDIPDKLSPRIKVRENKGPDSIYIKQPWQCEYCPYLDVTCTGALDKKFRNTSIVAKANDSGVLDYKQDDKPLNILIKRLYRNEFKRTG